MPKTTPTPPPIAGSSPQVILVSGMSGSGKTVALHALEDAGFFCVDNLPTALLPPFLNLAKDRQRRVAVAIDVREHSLQASAAGAALFSELEGLNQATILFLDCAEEILLRRFKTSRRPHPLVAQGIVPTTSEAIALERAWLAPIVHRAKHVIDTTQITVHDLRRRVMHLFGDEDSRQVQIHISSFGFRHGIPPEADFVFDLRYLDNPYFTPHLRDLSGLDPECADFVLSQPLAQKILQRVLGLFDDIYAPMRFEGRSAVTFVFGCTGGRHRSVAMASALADALRQQGHAPHVTHRDIER